MKSFSHFFLLLVAFVLTSCAHQSSSIRVASGVITEYDAECTCVTTTDGNLWAVDYDSCLQVGVSTLVVFNTLGDANFYNDEIIGIIIVEESEAI
jgi:hypothetical protein